MYLNYSTGIEIFNSIVMKSSGTVKSSDLEDPYIGVILSFPETLCPKESYKSTTGLINALEI